MTFISSPAVLASIGLTIAVMLGFFGLMGVRAVRIYLYQRGIKAARANESYVEFRRSFADQCIPEHILISVYQTLSYDISLVRHLPVRATDLLTDIYGIDAFSGTERGELVEMLAAQCCIPVVHPAKTASLLTVADLISLLVHAADAPYDPFYQGSELVPDEACCTVHPRVRIYIKNMGCT